ncbi:WbqC family protein [Streptomyces althioticus]
MELLQSGTQSRQGGDPALSLLRHLLLQHEVLVVEATSLSRRPSARQQWLTIPTHLPNGRPTLIRDARIDDPALACRRTAGMLRQHYGSSPHWPALARALGPVLDAFTTGRTVTVAEISTCVLLDLLGWNGQILTSSLPSRPGRLVRLADFSAATGAHAYLCGTGGMTYLDPAPFAARNIAVAPFRPPLINICSSGSQLSVL